MAVSTVAVVARIGVVCFNRYSCALQCCLMLLCLSGIVLHLFSVVRTAV